MTGTVTGGNVLYVCPYTISCNLTTEEIDFSPGVYASDGYFHVPAEDVTISADWAHIIENIVSSAPADQQPVKISDGSWLLKNVSSNHVLDITMSYAPVESVTLKDFTAYAGDVLYLNDLYTISPDTFYGTSREIVDAGETGAEIWNNQYIFLPSSGTVTLRLTLTDGKAPGSDYVQEFSFEVLEVPANVPATSDNSNMALWGLLLVMFAGVALATRRKKA